MPRSRCHRLLLATTSSWRIHDRARGAQSPRTRSGRRRTSWTSYPRRGQRSTARSPSCPMAMRGDCCSTRSCRHGHSRLTRRRHSTRATNRIARQRLARWSKRAARTALEMARLDLASSAGDTGQRIRRTKHPRGGSRHCWLDGMSDAASAPLRALCCGRRARHRRPRIGSPSWRLRSMPTRARVVRRRPRWARCCTTEKLTS